MTAQKHLKQLVRTRMAKTGERYATARRQLHRKPVEVPTDPALRWHFPGKVPATTALRVLLAHGGVRDLHTKQPFSEAMLFGIAGGIGMGLCCFLYEKENFASFFIAGRHWWMDDRAYLESAFKRFGIRPTVRETSGAKTADQQLRAALAEGPCIAWVDACNLPHRAMPSIWGGCGYHVVTVYRIDDEKKRALIADLGDGPIPIALADLAKARGRIKKDKHRVLTIPASDNPKELEPLIRGGLRACHEGLTGRVGPKHFQNWFSLEALRLWADRLHGSKDKERWERIFAPPRLWRGLVSIYDFIEHYGTGGGLCRPLFADFLNQAADAVGDRKLRALSVRYAELGRDWSELARAALPDDVPLLRESRELHAKKARLTRAGGPTEEIRAIWDRINALEAQAKERFPVSEAEAADLRAALQVRVRALYDGEKAAHADLADVVR